MLKNEGYIFTVFGSIIIFIIICIFYLKCKLKKRKCRKNTIVYPIPILTIEPIILTESLTENMSLDDS